MSFERTILIVAERFIASLNTHGKHPVSIDGRTWYPQSGKFLKLKYHLHSSLEKSLIENMIQYIKDRIDNLLIIFHVKKEM